MSTVVPVKAGTPVPGDWHNNTTELERSLARLQDDDVGARTTSGERRCQS